MTMVSVSVQNNVIFVVNVVNLQLSLSHTQIHTHTHTHTHTQMRLNLADVVAFEPCFEVLRVRWHQSLKLFGGGAVVLVGVLVGVGMRVRVVM